MVNHGHGVQAAAGIPLANRVASVFVHVTDLRTSAEWYSRLLGLPLMEERLNGGPVYWFDFQGTHLILDSNRVNLAKTRLGRRDDASHHVRGAGDRRSL